MELEQNRVGTVGGPNVDDWLYDLEDAVADGLGAAFERDFALKNLGESP